MARRVGIVGIGGLGHMGVKLSHALGAYTVAFTTSPDKIDAIKALGADEVVDGAEEEADRRRARGVGDDEQHALAGELEGREGLRGDSAHFLFAQKADGWGHFCDSSRHHFLR